MDFSNERRVVEELPDFLDPDAAKSRAAAALDDDEVDDQLRGVRYLCGRWNLKLIFCSG